MSVENADHGHRSGVDVTASAAATQSGHRMCPGCGRSIGWDAASCPYCQWSWGAQYDVVVASESIPRRRRILLYVGSLLIPIFGIVIGASYLSKRNESYRSVGTMCLVLGVISFILVPTFLSALLYVLVLGL